LSHPCATGAARQNAIVPGFGCSSLLGQNRRLTEGVGNLSEIEALRYENSPPIQSATRLISVTEAFSLIESLEWVHGAGLGLDVPKAIGPYVDDDYVIRRNVATHLACDICACVWAAGLGRPDVSDLNMRLEHAVQNQT